MPGPQGEPCLGVSFPEILGKGKAVTERTSPTAERPAPKWLLLTRSGLDKQALGECQTPSPQGLPSTVSPALVSHPGAAHPSSTSFHTPSPGRSCPLPHCVCPLITYSQLPFYFAAFPTVGIQQFAYFTLVLSDGIVPPPGTTPRLAGLSVGWMRKCYD